MLFSIIQGSRFVLYQSLPLNMHDVLQKRAFFFFFRTVAAPRGMPPSRVHRATPEGPRKDAFTKTVSARSRAKCFQLVAPAGVLSEFYHGPATGAGIGICDANALCFAA